MLYNPRKPQHEKSFFPPPFFHLAAPSWSETVIAGTTSIKNFPAHIAELREAVETIYTVINSKGAGTVIALPSWAAALTDIKPKATAIEELRNAVKEI